jgi:hypothetical protein
MKTSVVPAQVTTVEDKIAGNLNLTQLLLLATPIFVSSGVYIIFPPLLHLTLAKVILCFLIFVAFGILSIRVRGKILLTWMVLILRYRLRPRYYIFNKNDLHLRNSTDESPQPALADENSVQKVVKRLPIFSLPTAELVRLETAISDPRANFNFSANRKGGLDVRITQIK